MREREICSRERELRENDLVQREFLECRSGAERSLGAAASLFGVKGVSKESGFLDGEATFEKEIKFFCSLFFWATAASKIYTSLYTGLYTGLYARLNCFLERIKTSRAHWFLFCVKGVWNGVASLAAKILTKLASKIGFFLWSTERRI